MKQTGPILFFFKSFLHTIVDCCIMPGTANGTQILYLYAIQWKKKMSVVCFAFLLLMSSVESAGNPQVVTQQSFTDPEGL